MVQRWWHVVDGTRASRCKRHDAHSKGSCDAFKSRAFLPSALVEGADSSSSSVAGKQPVMMNSDAPGRGYMKRKVGFNFFERHQESGCVQRYSFLYYTLTVSAHLSTPCCFFHCFHLSCLYSYATTSICDSHSQLRSKKGRKQWRKIAPLELC